jgi:TRAP-type C4-dicarboxylate transport system permease small subunit
MLDKVIKGIHAAVRIFSWVGACAGAFMVIVIVLNVTGRFFFRLPLRGTIELVELMTVVMVYSVLPYAEYRKRSIHVDLVISVLPRRLKAVLASIMCFIGTIFFIVMSFEAGDLACSNLFPSVISTDTLSIPFAPFVLVIAVGSLLLGLEMLINAFHPLPQEKEQGGK